MFLVGVEEKNGAGLNENKQKKFVFVKKLFSNLFTMFFAYLFCRFVYLDASCLVEGGGNKVARHGVAGGLKGKRSGPCMDASRRHLHHDEAAKKMKKVRFCLNIWFPNLFFFPKLFPFNDF